MQQRRALGVKQCLQPGFHFVRAFDMQRLDAEGLRDRDEVEAALQALLDAKGPALLHVAIDTAANVWPLVPPNRNNAEMLDSSPLDDSRLDPQAEAATAATPTNPQEASHALPA